MNIEDFRNYCLSMKGVTEKIPFGRFAPRFDSLLVFYVLDHMFCMIDMDDFTSVSVRSTPDEIEDIRLRHTSVESPKNKALRYWIQLNLNGDIPDLEIQRLVMRSYEIIRDKYTPRRLVRIP
ncbi:MAG: MmcQ/YjbR family DNA-binding protein [Bacteroidales bacterium]|nr:MmcQ/YjbR family DNA-binding protein [Bacteroidales bacterium]